MAKIKNPVLNDTEIPIIKHYYLLMRKYAYWTIKTEWLIKLFLTLKW